MPRATPVRVHGALIWPIVACRLADPFTYGCSCVLQPARWEPETKQFSLATLTGAEGTIVPDIAFPGVSMAIERTLSIIKPDAVARNVIGQIYSRFENAGLKIVASRMVHLSRADAEKFYAVHAARPFFRDLVEFMCSRCRFRFWKAKTRS